MTVLKFAAEDLSPEDAAELIRLRVAAMLNGEVFVKPHYRKVPGWDALPSRKRLVRKARYALRITGSVEDAARFLSLTAAEVTSLRGRGRSPRGKR